MPGLDGAADFRIWVGHCHGSSDVRMGEYVATAAVMPGRAACSCLAAASCYCYHCCPPRATILLLPVRPSSTGRLVLGTTARLQLTGVHPLLDGGSTPPTPLPISPMPLPITPPLASHRRRGRWLSLTGKTWLASVMDRRIWKRRLLTSVVGGVVEKSMAAGVRMMVEHKN
ncbi:hypothetical protein ACLOJK_007551 [Asimina triloba]